jgi:hypothetical protein
MLQFGASLTIVIDTLTKAKVKFGESLTIVIDDTKAKLSLESNLRL